MPEGPGLILFRWCGVQGPRRGVPPDLRSFLGAIGLNGAASALDDPAQRSKAATAGWSRWAPVNAAAIGSHLVGAAGLLVTDWPRVRHQQGVAQSSAIKTAATGAGLGVAAWSAVLNRSMVKAGAVPVAGATEAALSTPPEVARTLRQLKLVQWLNPAAGLALIALSDWQSQQQRASQAAKGRVRRLLAARVSPVPAGALAAAIAVGVLASRQRKQAGQNTPAGLGDAEVKLGDAEVGDVEIDIVHVDLIDPSATRPPTPPPTPPTSGPGTPPRPAG